MASDFVVDLGERSVGLELLQGGEVSVVAHHPDIAVHDIEACGLRVDRDDLVQLPVPEETGHDHLLQPLQPRRKHILEQLLVRVARVLEDRLNSPADIQQRHGENRDGGREEKELEALEAGADPVEGQAATEATTDSVVEENRNYNRYEAVEENAAEKDQVPSLHELLGCLGKLRFGEGIGQEGLVALKVLDVLLQVALLVLEVLREPLPDIEFRHSILELREGVGQGLERESELFVDGIQVGSASRDGAQLLEVIRHNLGVVCGIVDVRVIDCNRFEGGVDIFDLLVQQVIAIRDALGVGREGVSLGLLDLRRDIDLKLLDEAFHFDENLLDPEPALGVAVGDAPDDLVDEPGHHADEAFGAIVDAAGGLDPEKGKDDHEKGEEVGEVKGPLSFELELVDRLSHASGGLLLLLLLLLLISLIRLRSLFSASAGAADDEGEQAAEVAEEGEQPK